MERWATVVCVHWSVAVERHYSSMHAFISRVPRVDHVGVYIPKVIAETNPLTNDCLVCTV